MKGIAGVLVIFLAGTASGYIGARHVYKERLEGFMRGNPEAFHEVIVRRLNRQLNLNAGQVSNLREILQQSHDEVAAAREDLSPEIQEILEETKTRVEAILTPPQVAAFRQLTEKEHNASGSTGNASTAAR